MAELKKIIVIENANYDRQQLNKAVENLSKILNKIVDFIERIDEKTKQHDSHITGIIKILEKIGGKHE